MLWVGKERRGICYKVIKKEILEWVGTYQTQGSYLGQREGSGLKATADQKIGIHIFRGGFSKKVEPKKPEPTKTDEQSEHKVSIQNG